MRREARSRRPLPSPFAAMPAEPPCACATASTIARPSPLPPRAAGVVAPREPLERTRGDVGREPAPLVADVELHRLADRSGADRDRALPVVERVVDEVPERLLESQPVCRHLGVAVGTSTTIRRRSRRRALREAVGGRARQLTEIDGLDPQPERLLVGPGDEQQVLREEDEPVGLLRRRADGCAELLCAFGDGAARARARPSGGRAECVARGSRRRRSGARARAPPRAASASR